MNWEPLVLCWIASTLPAGAAFPRCYELAANKALICPLLGRFALSQGRGYAISLPPQEISAKDWLTRGDQRSAPLPQDGPTLRCHLCLLASTQKPGEASLQLRYEEPSVTQVVFCSLPTSHPLPT